MKTYKRVSLIFLMFLIILTIVISCTKKIDLPTVTTANVTDITKTAAVSGGEVIDDGGSMIVARGICWNTQQNPTTSNFNSLTGGDIGQFSCPLLSLTPGTIYYVKAYAINSKGTAYGNEVSFTTNHIVSATLTTTEVLAIKSTTAISGGNITDNGGGDITARGLCWSTSVNPTTADNKTSNGTGSGIFTGTLTGLLSGQTYHVRAYATNLAGTTYGNDITFSTLAVFPTLITSAVSAITTTTATTGGNISDVEGVVITSRGVCWSIYSNPTILDSHTSDGIGAGTFESNLTGLSEGTVYYIRSYATCSAGTVYGDETKLLTYVSDTDGNTYKTIEIGYQIWFAENLKTTKYNNGIEIQSLWDDQTSPAYHWYNDDEQRYKNEYGALYNRWAVITGKICPIGWHVPSTFDWHTLMIFLDVNAIRTYRFNSQIAGGKLKEIGYEHWLSPNTEATNEVGFTALPGGSYDPSLGFAGIGEYGMWWLNDPESRIIRYNSAYVTGSEGGHSLFFSIRCLKD